MQKRKLLKTKSVAPQRLISRRLMWQVTTYIMREQEAKDN